MNGSRVAALAAWARLGKGIVPVIIGLVAGCQGPDGPVGADGEQGAPGEAGEQGEQGAQGDSGESGEPGAPGEAGQQGETGAQGDQGEPGAAGEDGEDGENGDAGADGEDGENGENGVNGTNGTNGINGINGTNGVDGDDGENGEDGRDGVDGVSGVGGGGDVTEAPVPGVAKVLSLSLTGHDRFYGATYDNAGNLYATGQISTDVSTTPGNPLLEPDFSLLVAKFTPEGVLDETFGNGGIVVENVAVGGRGQENARGIVVQATGKIVISGTAEHDVTATSPFDSDCDIVLLRFNVDGTRDTTFGANGIARFDLSTGVPGVDNQSRPTMLGRDANWSVGLAANDQLVVHGSQRGVGFEDDGTTDRVDNDWALLRLTADGAPDTTFGGDGLVTLDIEYEDTTVSPSRTVHTSGSARSATVLADGSVIGVGYMTSSALGVSTQQPVLYKVTAAGEFDATFATTDQWGQPGVWHDLAVTPPAGAEAYGFAAQGSNFVTIGYGPTNGTGTGTDFISFRFSANGDRDLTYGTNGNGATYVDGGGWGDNGRFVMVLPDERVLAVGVGRKPAAAQPARDGMVVILDEDGFPDESFGSGGRRLYDVGGDADHFWAAAISPTDFTQVAIVGIAGGVTAANDDDAVLLLLPVE